MVSEEQNNDIELASEVVPVPQVQPEVQAPEVIDVKNEKTNNVPRGKPRHRKKALHAAILKQMEFYFGDSNLSKDRFIAGLIKEDPNVDLEVFLSFNRIRALTTDKDRIAKALRKSTMLEVSEDGTKVRRVTPIVKKTNVDECTVYVQRLPTDADHEWLSTLFSEYGPVAYVSIPKFKHNRKIKGFAFIEFETPEGAEKCLKAFRKKGCELPSQTSPTDMLSITTYQDEDDMLSTTQEKPKAKKKRKKSVRLDDPGDCGTELLDSKKFKKKKDHDNDEKGTSTCASDSNTEGEEKRGKKRKNRTSLENVHNSDAESQKGIKEVEQLVSKKVQKNKDHDSDEKDINACASDSNTEGEEKRSKKRKNRTSLENVHDSDVELHKNVTENVKKPKKLKVDEDTKSENVTKNETEENKAEDVECSNEDLNAEKKKKKKRKHKHHNNYELLETADMGLQVMAKQDWKRLRNKYLDLQRAKMKQLKQHMKKARWNQNNDRNRFENENEYEREKEVVNKKQNPASNLEFKPGVIVKMELNEPCVDIRAFKAGLKSNSNIKYIDIKEGSTEAFIRCDTSEAANALVQKTTKEKSCTIITGPEEISYWDKIKSDRSQKIGNKVRVKVRGRDRLLKKAEKELGKHIKFDEV